MGEGEHLYEFVKLACFIGYDWLKLMTVQDSNDTFTVANFIKEQKSMQCIITAVLQEKMEKVNAKAFKRSNSVILIGFDQTSPGTLCPVLSIH